MICIPDLAHAGVAAHPPDLLSSLRFRFRFPPNNCGGRRTTSIPIPNPTPPDISGNFPNRPQPEEMEARNRRRKEEAERILLRAALDASVSRGGNPFASPPPVAAPRPSLASALRNLAGPTVDVPDRMPEITPITNPTAFRDVDDGGYGCGYAYGCAYEGERASSPPDCNQHRVSVATLSPPSFPTPPRPAPAAAASSSISGVTDEKLIENLRSRLAETSTQLTTVEDELRQTSERETSLRYAVNVLGRKGLDGDGNGQAGRGQGGAQSWGRGARRRRQEGAGAGGERNVGGEAENEDEDEDSFDELTSVTELLHDMGIRGPTSGGTAQVAVQVGRAKARAGSMSSRLATSERDRKRAQEALGRRDATVTKLRESVESAREQLNVVSKRAAKEKAGMEKRVREAEMREGELKRELDRFQGMLQALAQVDANGGETTGAAAAVQTEPHYRGPLHPAAKAESKREQVRAKARALLSLRREAEDTYEGAKENLEKMVARVYAQEVPRSGGGGGAGDKENRGPNPNLLLKKGKSGVDASRVDEVAEDFRILLETRGRMLDLHNRIRKKCEAILIDEQRQLGATTSIPGPLPGTYSI